jgi:hypothetical protein
MIHTTWGAEIVEYFVPQRSVTDFQRNIKNQNTNFNL